MQNMIWSGRVVGLILSCIVFISSQGQEKNYPKQAKLDIIPKPTSIESKGGYFHFNNGATLTYDDHFSEQIDSISLFLLDNYVFQRGETLEQLAIEFGYGLEEQDQEAYELEVLKDKVLIKANSAIGLSRGLATLVQLIYLNKQGDQFFIPLVKIIDAPSFEHRGLLFDCSRHFFEVEVVKKYIDLLALFKMNTLHWHLTEDQGWRIAIEKYPKLTTVAAYRTEMDGSTYGGFYSKEEIKELVAYAAERHITIIPEIELPGHSQAAIAAYPHLSCTGEAVDVANDWGVFKEIYCAGNDSVFTFLEEVLTEVMELFPSKKIHIGGDEAPKIRWEQCSKCQQRMVDEQLESEEELQSYFIRRIQAFLKANGRELIGWDEILEGGLAEGAIVQSWRGMQGGIEAVKEGHQAIMSPTSHAYFDYDLKAIDLQKVYNFQPVPAGLTGEEARLILGGECNLWSEHVPNEMTLDRKVFPRLLAMSEVLWSDSSHRDYQEFNERLQKFYPILDSLGVNYGEESVPMSHEVFLEKQNAVISLIPYSGAIALSYQFDCEECDTNFREYVKPLKIEQSSILKVQPYKQQKKYGDLIEIPFAHHEAINAAVTYQSDYSKWYTAGGERGLVDSKLGTLDFRDGSWQGFWGNDVELIIDVGRESRLSSVSANFYQYNNSWIFIPQKMEVEYSLDGKNWTDFGSALSDVDPKKRGKFIHTLGVHGLDYTAYRYLKIKVENLGKVPDWHEAAGSDAWIFMDEIMVK